ncbi:MAG: amidohydrolase family protein [Deltaproteobacteria bacterium]|nr:amidohydrolase family protein [Deltaproteobacteria bacterium]
MIDAHVHVGDWKYFRTNARFPLSAAETLEGLRRRGFSGTVLMPSECKGNEELLAEIRNSDFTADFRIFLFPWVHPGNREDTHFLKVHRREVSGIKIHPSLDRTPLTDPGYHRALSLAEDLQLPVLVHCGQWRETAGYEKVLHIAEKRPGIVLIMAHMGGDGYELKRQAARKVKDSGLTNIYMDTAGTHENWILEECVAALGAHRFLMGSDWPIREPLLYPVLVRNSRLSEEEKERILGINAWTLLCKGKTEPVE